MAQLSADEGFPFPVVENLRQLGHDIITTLEAGRASQGVDDAAQLAYASGLGRAILTRNRRHYIPLHKLTSAHAGIISITDDPDFDGQALRIHQAIVSLSSLSGQHVRVNRLQKHGKPCGLLHGLHSGPCAPLSRDRETCVEKMTYDQIAEFVR